MAQGGQTDNRDNGAEDASKNAPERGKDSGMSKAPKRETRLSAQAGAAKTPPSNSGAPIEKDENESKARERLGFGLKTMYRSVLDEPLPDDMKALLDQLEADTPADEPGDDQDGPR